MSEPDSQQKQVSSSSAGSNSHDLCLPCGQHISTEQVLPVPQGPHEPPQPSSPHSLPEQSGVPGTQVCSTPLTQRGLSVRWHALTPQVVLAPVIGSKTQPLASRAGSVGAHRPTRHGLEVVQALSLVHPVADGAVAVGLVSFFFFFFF